MGPLARLWPTWPHVAAHSLPMNGPSSALFRVAASRRPIDAFSPRQACTIPDAPQSSILDPIPCQQSATRPMSRRRIHVPRQTVAMLELWPASHILHSDRLECHSSSARFYWSPMLRMTLLSWSRVRMPIPLSYAAGRRIAHLAPLCRSYASWHRDCNTVRT